MPPKVKITREEIVRAATEMVRTCGADALNARGLATALGCSTQPIFSNFKSMNELCDAVTEVAMNTYEDYTRREVARGEYPPYKASGMAYILFAREEPEFFKLLYMRDRSGELIPEHTELSDRMEALVHKNTGLEGDATRLFHLEMWAYVHGIATMLATGFLNLETEIISRMLTDSYQGLRKQYGMEG